ncbi:MAG: Mur ligase family protein, partial [Verrucomicrobiota bacterium]|nr:Mur ligase family protein [Verrucomicrobiota bacterium]
FTSPHLITFRERICAGGEMIGERDVAEGLTRMRELVSGWQHSPTFFEITTALALAHFQQERIEVVVLETGMGGRLDATNVVTPLASVITSIALDHQQWLGSTLGAIAAEKAGIIKLGVPAISTPQPEEVDRVLRQIAAERQAPLHFVTGPLEDLPIGLAGRHQRWNAALAVRALEMAGLSISQGAIVSGLKKVRWPGRFERIRPNIVLDGAHNPAAAKQLAQTWRDFYGDSPATLILGVLGDKDLRGICTELLPLAERVITVRVRSPRSSDPEALRAVVREVRPPCDCVAAADLEAALEIADRYSEPILIAGSLFLVGEASARLSARVEGVRERAQ